MLPNRYNRHNIYRVFKKPSLLIKETRRLSSNIIYPINNVYFNRKYGRGIDIIDQDWDNLIILDACRYDYFKEMNTIDGELRPVLSQGSHSFELYNVYCRKLRIVPWLEIESQNRRDVIAEEPIKQQNIDTTIIDQRLQALGYKPV